MTLTKEQRERLLAPLPSFRPCYVHEGIVRNDLQDRAIELQEELRALLAAFDAAQRDAERYQWLREQSVDQWEHPIVVMQDRVADHMKYIGPLCGTSLDQSIDAAIAATNAPSA